MKLLVTNIQRFSLHDGPGIRTTVFMKGCTLHCPWCCNPENISPHKQYYFQEKKCIAKAGSCAYGRCPFVYVRDVRKCLSQLTEKEFRQCKSGAIGEYGRWYGAEELTVELMSDAPFWGRTGGVTFSGGEPLLQMSALEEVAGCLKKKGINLCVETSLYVPMEFVEKAVCLFDELYIDIKLLDRKRVKQILGGDIELYLQNLNIVFRSGLPVCLRHPQIRGYTDDPETESLIQSLLDKYPSFSYQVLEEHHLGDEKNRTLGYGNWSIWKFSKQGQDVC